MRCGPRRDEARPSSAHLLAERESCPRVTFETVTGCAEPPADYVISGEQVTPAPGCASTYAAESRRGDWYRWPTGTGAVHGRFSLVARFQARGGGRRAICSYLVSRSANRTFAHAGLIWTNS